MSEKQMTGSVGVGDGVKRVYSSEQKARARLRK